MHRCPWCGEPCDCDETDMPSHDCSHDCGGDDVRNSGRRAATAGGRTATVWELAVPTPDFEGELVTQ